MALILWQYLKMVSFPESIKTLLTVNENCLQHSLELGNCQGGYYVDVDSSAFELLSLFKQVSKNLLCDFQIHSFFLTLVDAGFNDMLCKIIGASFDLLKEILGLV